MSFDDETSGIVELSTSRSENNSGQDSSSHTSPNSNENCEQGRGSRHVRAGRQLPVLKKVRNVLDWTALRGFSYSKPQVWSDAQISYQMMTYPLVYLLIWAIPTSIRIYQAVTGNPAPFGIATVDKVRTSMLLFMKTLSLHIVFSSQSDLSPNRALIGMHCHPRPRRCHRIRCVSSVTELTSAWILTSNRT